MSAFSLTSMFAVEGKIALVTGAASGIGLCIAKELLRNGLKGVTLADINISNGKKALEEIENEFGEGKAIYVKTDVANKDEFENAFKKTIERFTYIDILINGAGIMNDAEWEKEIAINLNGTVNGNILGLENYLKNHKQGDEAVILNTSSIAGVMGYGLLPVYCATKFAVLGLTKCWSSPLHFKRTKVRVVAVCPGKTDTAIFSVDNYTISPDYMENWAETTQDAGTEMQKPEAVSKEVVRILKYGKNGTAWIVEHGEPAYEFIIPDRTSFKNNILIDGQ